MDDTSRAIGNLEAKIDAIMSSIQTLGSQQIAYQGTSDAGRKKIYEELEKIRSDASASRTKIDSVTDRLNEAEPVITDIQKWRERFIGMGLLAAAIGALLGGALSLFWSWIAQKLGIN